MKYFMLTDEDGNTTTLYRDPIAALAGAVRIVKQCLKLIEDEREVLERSFLPEPSKSEEDILTAYEEATVAAKAFLEANQ